MSSKKYFRVEGNAVHLVTERVERTVRLEDLMGEVVKEQGLTTPLLPAGCRYYRASQDKELFIIEQAPQVRTITYCGTRYKLAFPYVIFVLPFNGDGAVLTDYLSVYYRAKPVSSMSDEVAYCNLWNMHDNGVGMCTGNMRTTGNNTAQKTESFVATFWKSPFNNDITGLYNQSARQIEQVSSRERWAEETEKNPLFPLAVKWIPAGKLDNLISGRLS